jgi:hypothetical protein
MELTLEELHYILDSLQEMPFAPNNKKVDITVLEEKLNKLIKKEKENGNN